MGQRPEQGGCKMKRVHGVPRGFKTPAASECVVSRVFVRHGGDDGFRHIVSNRLVGHGMPIVATIAFAALSKLRIRLIRFADAGKHPSGNERRIIETVLRRQPELFPHGQSRKLRAGAYGSVVGGDPENTLGLPSVVIALPAAWFEG